MFIGHYGVAFGVKSAEKRSAPVNLGAVANSAANDQHPTTSKDGLTLIFISNRPGGCGGNDLYRSTRTKLTAPQ